VRRLHRQGKRAPGRQRGHRLFSDWVNVRSVNGEKKMILQRRKRNRNMWVRDSLFNQKKPTHTRGGGKEEKKSLVLPRRGRVKKVSIPKRTESRSWGEKRVLFCAEGGCRKTGGKKGGVHPRGIFHAPGRADLFPNIEGGRVR